MTKTKNTNTKKVVQLLAIAGLFALFTLPMAAAETQATLPEDACTAQDLEDCVEHGGVAVFVPVPPPGKCVCIWIESPSSLLLGLL